MTGARSSASRHYGMEVPWTGCPATGKRGYASRSDAKRALSRWHGVDRTGLAVYLCIHCDRHHIGTQGTHTREDHRAHHAGTSTDPTWITLDAAARQLQPRNLDRMRAVLQRAADEGRVQAIAALGVTLIHRDEIPRLRLAAHDARQDDRLKEL